MIRKIKQVFTGLVLVPALVFTNTVHAEDSMIDRFSNQAYDALDVIVAKITTPLFGPKDTECLARNIYFESKNEPEEGMVAVGLVTINRAQDERYPNTVCGVVNHRTKFGEVVICQFSWTCTPAKNKKILPEDPMWQRSLEVAQRLSLGEYPQWQKKYAKSFHFHSAHINPNWKLKRIARVGNHIFYH
jgi:spore germination cell wall hydrolase CwlJ-like protein